jgi:hypothetical protein
MKQILIIITTFILAFTTSLLMDWSWIKANMMREGLVILLIVLELITGYFIIKSSLVNEK